MLPGDLAILFLLPMAVIIAFSAFLGYALAGFTLKPIQDNQEVQRRFMSDASHELRTPLSIMKTGIEVELRNPANPMECKPVLNSNLEEINRMSDLVENLLFILRADSGNEDFKFETLDLSQIISTVFQNMKPYAAAKKSNFKLGKSKYSGHSCRNNKRDGNIKNVSRC